MKNTILVFGGSGYVGSKLVVKLLKKYKVVNFDRIFWLKHLPFKNENFHHIKAAYVILKKYLVLKKFKPKFIIQLHVFQMIQHFAKFKII